MNHHAESKKERAQGTATTPAVEIHRAFQVTRELRPFFGFDTLRTQPKDLALTLMSMNYVRFAGLHPVGRHLTGLRLHSPIHFVH